MSSHFSFMGLLLLCCELVYGEAPKIEVQFHIEKCSSGIDYPTKGDESVDVEYEGRKYHVRIYHPHVVDGPHFSTPFFWISGKDQKAEYQSLLSVRSLIAGLGWHSIDGYFFAELDGELRGFFLEDGFDNADNGSSGLIFLHDGGKSSAWKWSYIREARQNEGQYEITDANDPKKAVPEALLRRIASVIEYAAVQAEFWPGP